MFDILFSLAYLNGDAEGVVVLYVVLVVSFYATVFLIKGDLLLC